MELWNTELDIDVCKSRKTASLGSPRTSCGDIGSWELQIQWCPNALPWSTFPNGVICLSRQRKHANRLLSSSLYEYFACGPTGAEIYNRCSKIDIEFKSAGIHSALQEVWAYIL